MTVVFAAIDQVAEPSGAVNTDGVSVPLVDELLIELVEGISDGSTTWSEDVERVEDEPSETLTVALPTLIVTEVEYDVEPSVMMPTATLDEVVNTIVLKPSVPVVLGRPVLVSEGCSVVTVVGTMYSVPSIVLMNPVATTVEKLVSEDVVPSVTTGITTEEVVVIGSKVKEDDDSDGEAGGLSVGEPVTEAITEVVT